MNRRRFSLPKEFTVLSPRNIFSSDVVGVYQGQRCAESPTPKGRWSTKGAQELPLGVVVIDQRSVRDALNESIVLNVA